MSKRLRGVFAAVATASTADREVDCARSIALARYLLEEGGVATLGGSSFGPAGHGHLRIAYATSSTELRRALARMQRALAAYPSPP